MSSAIESFMPLDSYVHQWDPRTKFIGLVLLIFTFATVTKLELIPLMLGITLSLYKLSRLPISFWLRRLRYPGLFLVAITVFLPFLSGDQILWQLGPMVVRQEGSLAALLIASRFLCILTLSLVLLGTTPFLTLVKVMRLLRLPAVLTDMLLLTYRYLAEISLDLRKMQQAMQLRGFNHQAGSTVLLPTQYLSKGRHLGRLASLVGTLLIRSYERSERVYQAMRLRGYSWSTSLAWSDPPNPWSWGGMAIMISLAIGLMTAQIL